MWLFAPWGNRTKGIITGVVAAFVIVSIINDAATVEPKLAMSAPAKATTVTKPVFQVEGKVTPEDATIRVNGENVTPNNDGSFDAAVDLTKGQNEVSVVAINGSKEVEYSRVVTRKLSAAEIAARKDAEEKASKEKAEREAEEEARLEAEKQAEAERKRAEKQAQKEAEAEAESARTPEPISLSGSGQQATDPFTLESGLAIMSMTHQGDANFIVDLLDESGISVAPMGLANEIGPFEGSIALQTSAGEHLLDVQANGPWTINVEQPRPSNAPKSRSFSGDSKTATALFELSGGLTTFEMTHQGDANFIVDLLDENGASVSPMGLVNEIGPFNGSKALAVPGSGIYLLQIEANGPWTIEIEE